MIVILSIYDEHGFYVAPSTTLAEAFETLRQYLNGESVSYQDPLPENATEEQIRDAADDRSQFAWDMTEHPVPGGTTETQWGFRHPGYPHVSWSEPHVETQWTGHDGWTTGPYTEKDARYYAQGRPVVKREVTTFPSTITTTEWEDA